MCSNQIESPNGQSFREVSRKLVISFYPYCKMRRTIFFNVLIDMISIWLV